VPRAPSSTSLSQAQIQHNHLLCSKGTLYSSDVFEDCSLLAPLGSIKFTQGSIASRRRCLADSGADRYGTWGRSVDLRLCCDRYNPRRKSQRFPLSWGSLVVGRLARVYARNLPCVASSPHLTLLSIHKAGVRYQSSSATQLPRPRHPDTLRKWLRYSVAFHTLQLSPDRARSSGCKPRKLWSTATSMVY
jgi:hypothetical protein